MKTTYVEYTIKIPMLNVIAIIKPGLGLLRFRNYYLLQKSNARREQHFSDKSFCSTLKSCECFMKA